MTRIVLLAAVLAALALAAPPAHAFGHKCIAVAVPVAPSYAAPAFAVAPQATYAAAPVATYAVAAPVTTYAVAAPPPVQMVPVSLAPVQMIAPQATYAVAPQAAYAAPQNYRLVPQQAMPRASDCDRDRDPFERIGPPRGAAAAGPSTGELSDRLDRLSRAVEELAGVVRRHGEQLKQK